MCAVTRNAPDGHADPMPSETLLRIVRTKHWKKKIACSMRMAAAQPIINVGIDLESTAHPPTQLPTSGANC